MTCIVIANTSVATESTLYDSKLTGREILERLFPLSPSRTILRLAVINENGRKEFHHANQC